MVWPLTTLGCNHNFSCISCLFRWCACSPPALDFVLRNFINFVALYVYAMHSRESQTMYVHAFNAAGSHIHLSLLNSSPTTSAIHIFFFFTKMKSTKVGENDK